MTYCVINGMECFIAGYSQHQQNCGEHGKVSSFYFTHLNNISSFVFIFDQY